MSLKGAIEAGGTKFICAVGTGANNILDQVTIKTRSPEITLPECLAFFRKCADRQGTISSLGIAAFGPLELNPADPAYGCILKTPKRDWAGVNLVEYYSDQLSVPVVLDTDVNAAVIAECRYGNARSASNAVYVTVGTGIGAGIIANGKITHGLIHPELGHIPLPRHPKDTSFASACPFHDDCLEGLASGSAMHHRWGAPAQGLGPHHDAWKLEAFYLGQMCRTLTFALSPERIILGGGVMGKKGLIEQVRRETAKALGDYLPVAQKAGGWENYIVPQSLTSQSGLVGAFALLDND